MCVDNGSSTIRNERQFARIAYPRRAGAICFAWGKFSAVPKIFISRTSGLASPKIVGKYFHVWAVRRSSTMRYFSFALTTMAKTTFLYLREVLVSPT